ncbi:MAG: hypothetical protein KF789_07200 [Bdellovibrionaceae bacterium]|nr:hypothetical protein [Pseudobdellovibrionaceae bacterium]
MHRLAALASVFSCILIFTPLAASAQDDCKAVHGLLVEGTGEMNDTAEEMFQNLVAQWGDAYADLSTSVSVIPATNQGKYIQRANQKKRKALADLIEKTPAGEICSNDVITFAFMKFAVGKMNETVEVSPDELTSYQSGNINLSARSNVNIEKGITLMGEPKSGPSDGSSGGSMGSLGGDNKPSLQGFQHSALLKKIRETKARCGDKADQVVMVNLASHGTDKCKFLLDGETPLSPEHIKKMLIEPLAAENVRVVLNFSNCYGGCFVDQMKDLKLPGGACFTSSTRASTVAYASDGIVAGTYEQSYPDYLRRLKNPLKAHLCATLWDPLNEPQSKGVAPTRSRSGDRLSNQRAETIEDIGKKFDFPNLASECPPPKQPDFFGLPDVSEEKVKALFSCPAIRKGFEKAGVKGDHDVFFGAIQNPNSAPGLDSLRKLAADPAAIQSLKDGCNINLASYGGSASKKGTGADETTAGDKKGGKR